MLEGITRQMCASCSEHGVPCHDSTVRVLHTDNAIDSTSIQSVAHTNASSLVSKVPSCQSVESSLNPAATSFNPEPRSGASHGRITHYNF